MTKKEQVKNIIAFLSILFGEDFLLSHKIFELSPDYLIEKYERYILSQRPEGDWGVHPNLKTRIIEPYMEKFKHILD